MRLEATISCFQLLLVKQYQLLQEERQRILGWTAKRELSKLNYHIHTILLTEDDIRHRIYAIRGVQVMLDKDLALLYEVETKRINEAVKTKSNKVPC